MSMHRRRTVTLVFAVCTLALLAAPAAAAEGSFSTSFSGWLTGHSSRTWSDTNRDSSSTTIALGNCTTRASATRKITPRLQLTREAPWYLPDENKGRKDFSCWYSTDSESWGRQSSGSYHFTLTHVNGTEFFDDKISASTVRVAY